LSNRPTVDEKSLQFLEKRKKMERPILSLTSGDPPKSTPNLLPCRINHNGSIEPIDSSFWDPQTGDGEFIFPPHFCHQRSHLPDGAKTVYFRGRKLHGKTVKLPEGYRGIVASAAPKAEEKKSTFGDVEVVDLVDDEQSRAPQGVMNVQAEFDEMVVWGHESTADASGDPYVRGMEEWLTLADQVGGLVYADDARTDDWADSHVPCTEEGSLMG
jgi:ribonuclease H2 subunit C